jgi:choline dehydrogenase
VSRSPCCLQCPDLISNRYLTEKEDITKLVRGVRLISKIAHQEPLASRLDHSDKNPLLDSDTHLKTDAELEELIRDRVETLYHPASTCRMAPLGQGGVVDSHLRVYGVKGLRVCDASIFPEIPSGHTVSRCRFNLQLIFTS